jgi:hypothetical protein
VAKSGGLEFLPFGPSTLRCLLCDAEQGNGINGKGQSGSITEPTDAEITFFIWRTRTRPHSIRAPWKCPRRLPWNVRGTCCGCGYRPLCNFVK